MQQFDGATMRAMLTVLVLTLWFPNADADGYTVNDTKVLEPLMSVFVLPDEAVILEFEQPVASVKSQSIHFKMRQGAFVGSAPSKPGLYPVTIQPNKKNGESVLNVFVLTPYELMSDGKLERYRIGDYPLKRMKGLGSYSRPKGFLRVTDNMLNQPLTDHFTVSQFLCKQQSGYPKFMSLQTDGLIMFEGFLRYVNQRGFSVDTFGVISAYRTPHYNRSLGNARYSRHIYGDAMDLFIDQDKDGRMDDLNGDGQHNNKDVDLLFELASDFHKESGYVGGIGKYYSTQNHGGFVHIDNRGYKARW